MFFLQCRDLKVSRALLDHLAHLDLRVSPAPREWLERLVWWENRWKMDTDHYTCRSVMTLPWCIALIIQICYITVMYCIRQADLYVLYGEDCCSVWYVMSINVQWVYWSDERQWIWGDGNWALQIAHLNDNRYQVTVITKSEDVWAMHAAASRW